MAFRIVSCVDAAYGVSERADYTAIATGGLNLAVLPRIEIHLLDVFQQRLPLAQVPKAIEDQYRKWRPMAVGIENTLWQVSLIQTMRRVGRVPFYEIDRRKAHNPDKKTRAGKLAFHYSERHIVHPRPVPDHWRLWVGNRELRGAEALAAFEEQLLGFTGEPGRDDHDDMVDAWVDVVDALTLQAQVGEGPPREIPFTFDAEEVQDDATTDLLRELARA